MRMQLALIAGALMIPVSAHAGSQSSNSSSNSSSNNGVVRERVAETHCDGRYCERYTARRVYRDDGYQRRFRDNDRRRLKYYRHYRHGEEDD